MSCFLLCAAPLSAQTTLLSEDFSSGWPAGWMQVHNPGNLATGWYHDSAQGVMRHSGQFDANNTLVSPALDLSSMSQAYLHFDGETENSWWLHTHESAQGNGYSTIEVTVDGGQSWDILWDDASIDDDTYRFSLDLAPYLGPSQVHLGFHYRGDLDHALKIDHVLVDDRPVDAVSLEPGFIQAPFRSYLIIKGATRNQVVKAAYSRTGNAPTQTRFGVAHLSAPILPFGLDVADNNGTATIRFQPPAASVGRTLHVQVVDWRTGTLSNPLSVVIP